jgi:hypothetical protein
MGDRGEIQWLYCMVFEYNDETNENRKAVLEQSEYFPKKTKETVVLLQHLSQP